MTSLSFDKNVSLLVVEIKQQMEQQLCNGLPATTRGWIPHGDGVKTELHVLHKGQ